MHRILPCREYGVLMDSADLAAMRHEYEAPGLTEEAAGEDPVSLFQRWLDDAVTAGVGEPNAMVVATATATGRPSARVVLLKGLSDAGAVFFTNYQSRKGEELAENPYAAAVLPWHDMQRQVRVEGPVERVSAEESDAYFARRPEGSRIGSAASPQSRPVTGRDELDRLWNEAVNERRGDARPDHWGGFRIGLDVVEFWQGGRDRFHDRIRFRRDGSGWIKDRLAP